MQRSIVCGIFTALMFAVVPLFGQVTFRDVTDESGLGKPLLGMMGHGGAWGDYDGDGHVDLYVGGFADRPNDEYAPAAGPMKNVLLRNLGNGKFRPVKSSTQHYGRTSGALFVDLDNDGDLELFVANNGKGQSRREIEPQRTAQLAYSRLFRNDDGTFVDISEESGACRAELGTARNIGALDYNGDGLLDLLVLEDMFTKEPGSILYKNLGGLRFQPATDCGLPTDVFGLGLAVADVNEDGRADFFVGHSNRMFLSTAKGKFVEHESLTKTFAWPAEDREDWPCGAHFADLNNDGRLDLILAIHFQRARNRIYLNEGLDGQGIPKFRDVTEATGLPKRLNNKSPHVEAQDFNNDGWLDLYFSTAWLADGEITPLIYINQGVKNGAVPRFKLNRRVDAEMVYFPAGPSADFDRDGKLDLCLINWFRGNRTRLLKNETDGENNWLEISVVGKTFNRNGLGTKVSVFSAGALGDQGKLLGHQELTIGYGYASGQEAVSHFGLGRAETVDLLVRLPDNTERKLAGVKANQRLVISQ